MSEAFRFPRSLDMSNSTTAETPTMRERLEQSLLDNQGYAWFGRERAEKLTDAILREMLEPGEGMRAAIVSALCAGPPGDVDADAVIAWQAGVQHILNEPKG